MGAEWWQRRAVALLGDLRSIHVRGRETGAQHGSGVAVRLSTNGRVIDDVRSRVRRPPGLETTRVRLLREYGYAAFAAEVQRAACRQTPLRPTRLTATLAVRLVVRVVVDYKPSHGTSLGAVAAAVHPRGTGNGLLLLSQVAGVRRCEEPRDHSRAELFRAAQYVSVQRGPFDGRAVQAHGGTRRSLRTGTRGIDGAHPPLQATARQDHQARRFQHRDQSWPLRGRGRA